MTETRFSLGIQAFRAGDMAEAERHLRAALDEPAAAILAQTNLGILLMNTGRPAEAVPLLLATAERQPDLPQHWAALAKAASKAEQHAVAARAYSELVRRMPTVELKRELAEALYKAGDHASAEDVLLKVEAEAPHGIGQMLLGHCAGRRQDIQGAIGYFRKAVAMLPPETVAARTCHWMMGLNLLTLGDFDHGWAEMEWRLSLEPLATPHAEWNARMPEWDGTLTPGLRVIAHYEQGLGDTLQFVRYLPILRSHGLHVTLAAQPGLVRLLRRQGTALADTVIDGDGAIPPGDAHVWLMSLPAKLRPVLRGDIPTATPYLAADPAITERARARLKQASGGLPAIGLVWAGNPRHHRDKSRSIPYPALLPLLDQKGVKFFSFQMGPARDEFRAAPHPNLIDVTDGLSDFDDTAAAMAGLDGLISVDSAPAHLAGALKIPTAVLVARSHDWRWGTPHLLRSPWYPGMVLYRQAEDLEWGPLLRRLAHRLATGSAFVNQF